MLKVLWMEAYSGTVTVAVAFPPQSVTASTTDATRVVVLKGTPAISMKELCGGAVGGVER